MAMSLLLRSPQFIIVLKEVKVYNLGENNNLRPERFDFLRSEWLIEGGLFFSLIITPY